MKKQLLVILLALIALTVNAQKKSKIKGNKQVIDVVKAIPNGFNKIEVSDDLELSINQTFYNGYTLKTDENLVDVIQFAVEDSILKIYTSHRIVSKKKLEINLSFKQLDEIVLKGDSEIKGVGKIKSDSLSIEGYSSSRFELDIEATAFKVTLQKNAGGKLKVKSEDAVIVMNDRTDLKAYLVSETAKAELSKSSQLTLDGEVNTAAFNLKETSELHAKEMKVSSASLYTSNASDVYIYASKNLELYAEGKSNIFVYGNPSVNVKGLADKSKIIKK